MHLIPTIIIFKAVIDKAQPGTGKFTNLTLKLKVSINTMDTSVLVRI